MFINERMHRCDQAWDFPPHHRQSGRGVALSRDSGHEIEVSIEALPQLSEQDQVAHRRSPPELARSSRLIGHSLRLIDYGLGRALPQGQPHCGAKRKKPLLGCVRFFAVQGRCDDHSCSRKHRGLREGQFDNDPNRLLRLCHLHASRQSHPSRKQRHSPGTASTVPWRAPFAGIG
ncbi:hypothetical protein [Lentzea kentuckyensis]|uniref:hypothetical protein n=1 Tax=Lentzea kentuckyensis TaxID=360086 RepID=UPI00117ABB55|nr:hypothetical protein [Lentzea kentuckyensis]